MDIAYKIRGALAEELRRTPGLTLKPNVGQATHWVYFAEQWDPKSPWHDRRVRLAANHAIDRHGHEPGRRRSGSRSSPSASSPSSFEFYWQPPGYPLRSAHGPSNSWPRPVTPNGFDAGDYFCDAAITNIGEARRQLSERGGHPGEAPPHRAGRLLQGLVPRRNTRGSSRGPAAPSATPPPGIEAFIAGGGTYAYGGYPDIDGLFREQANELDPKRREATLHRIQQLVHDKVMVAPIWLNAGLYGLGPRVEESGIGLIAGLAWSGPYEDVKLRGK